MHRYENILEWQKDKEQQVAPNDPEDAPEIFRSRPSARFGAQKTRPLHVKLEMLLELIFRRMVGSDGGEYSVDNMQRIVKKIDKDMGN